MEQKRCVRCELVKSLDSFSKDSRKKDGRRSYCKVCEGKSKAAQRAMNRESGAMNRYNKEYWERNKETLIMRRREEWRKYWRKNKNKLNRRKRMIYRLKPLAGKMPTWKIGETLGMPDLTVISWARKLNISLNVYKTRWTPAENKELWDLYKNKGYTKARCAEILNRSHEAVKYQLRVLEGKI